MTDWQAQPFCTGRGHHDRVDVGGRWTLTEDGTPTRVDAPRQPPGAPELWMAAPRQNADYTGRARIGGAAYAAASLDQRCIGRDRRTGRRCSHHHEYNPASMTTLLRGLRELGLVEVDLSYRR